MAILISDKIDFKTKAVKRDKEGHDIVIRGSIQEKDIIINIYAPNIGAPQYVKTNANSMKGEINNNTIIVGEENGNPLQRSCLENPSDGGAWWAAVYGVAQSRTRLKRLSSSSFFVTHHQKTGST